MSSDLSPREREILTAIYDGRSAAEIAQAAGIAESTVGWHVANIKRKLRARTRAEAVVTAYRRGLVDEPPHRSALARLGERRTGTQHARAVADLTLRWAIAAVLVVVALIGLSGALTSAPLFRIAPPTTVPILVPPSTSSPRP